MSQIEKLMASVNVRYWIPLHVYVVFWQREVVEQMSQMKMRTVQDMINQVLAEYAVSISFVTLAGW